MNELRYIEEQINTKQYRINHLRSYGASMYEYDKELKILLNIQIILQKHYNKRK